MMTKPLTLAALALLTLPASALAFEGQYRAGVAGYDQTLAVEKIEGKQFRLQATVNTKGCTGKVEAEGTLKDNLLTAKTTTKSGDICTITLFKAGPNLQLEEDQCESLHGPTCEFTNTYSPR